MKKQTIQNLAVSIQSLGIVFVLLLTTAFACDGGDNNAITQKGAPTEADVKQYVTRKAEASATGVGSQPKSVKLTFESIRFGKPRKPTDIETNVKMYYPVRVKYTAHYTWGNGGTRDDQIHYDYEFYVDAYDEWNAGMIGPVT